MSRKKPEIKQEIVVDKPEPHIVSITVNSNGTFFGLADNKIYTYDQQTKKWNLV
jgi:hypothetical protein